MEDQGNRQVLPAATRAHAALGKITQKMTASQLREVASRTTEVLGELREALVVVSELKRARKWGEAIDRLQSQSRMPRFVIGVRGNTGTGKSSLINAVLGEEKVVPTSCMRACTAVIAEISWNFSNDPTKKYRAEIHFMTQSEWTNEVQKLYRDMLDPNGQVSAEIHDSDSDAAVAYDTLRAVYPTHTMDQFRKTDPVVLSEHASVKKLLGGVRFVENATCAEFYSAIQEYVDSEKNTKNNSETATNDSQKRQMAGWPVIKVVQMFLKSEILSTGAVLVDLPGTGDTNAARGAIAARYARECSRLWIVADINRAVNDKAAKDLLGHTFKRQLKVDNMSSKITFVCTKADMISIDDAAETLNLRDFLTGERQRLNDMELEIDAKKREMENLEAKRAEYQKRHEAIKSELDTWEPLHKQVIKGRRAFRPLESPRKRKRGALAGAKESPVSKKMKNTIPGSETEGGSSDESDQEDGSDDDVFQEELTVEETGPKVADLKALKKSLHAEKREIIRLIAEIKLSKKDLGSQLSKVKTGMHRACIQGRNEFSRAAIQKDFAFGMKELDEDLLARQKEDDGHQHMESDAYYEQIGRDLPVFCVSTRAYQKKCGRMKNDTKVEGFISADDTELPALQQHTLDLTETIQASYFKRHLNEVGRVLRSLDLFLAGDAAVQQLSDNEREEESAFLQQSLLKLKKALDEELSACMAECKQAARNVLDRMPRAVTNASARARPTAKAWGGEGDADGLHYCTYKATCRRDGAFRGRHGHRDFNEELLQPLEDHIAWAWSLTFNNRVPQLLDTCASKFAQLINALQDRMKCRPFLHENSDLVYDTRMRQSQALDDALMGLSLQHKQRFDAGQRSANRRFYPFFQAAMRPVYSRCALVTGKGAYDKMRVLMDEALQHEIFRDTANDTAQAIGEILHDLENTIRQDMNVVIDGLEQDFTSLFGAVTTESDNRARQALEPVLSGVYQKLLVSFAEAEKEAATTAEAKVKKELNVDEGRDNLPELDVDIE